MTDEEGLLQKLREKGRSVPRPSFSAHQAAQSAWDTIDEALEALADAIRSFWRSVPS